MCVCLGNICRSPTAEGILKAKLKAKGLQVEVDSAGTSGWHNGAPPDGRSKEHALKRGYDLVGASRAVEVSDFNRFDLILAMDQKNLFDLQSLAKQAGQEAHLHKVKLITDYCVEHTPQAVAQGVPDPYYKGELGFELVLDILEDACGELIQKHF